MSMAITATHKTTGPLSSLKLSMMFHRQDLGPPGRAAPCRKSVCVVSRVAMRELDEAAAVAAHQRAQQLAPHAVPVPQREQPIEHDGEQRDADQEPPDLVTHVGLMAEKKSEKH